MIRMKKSGFLFFLFILALFSLVATPTAKSVMYSNSYLLRAWGVDALYWNPAALGESRNNLVLPILNQMIYVTNNAFDISTYNSLVGEYLTQNDKDKIMRRIGSKLMINEESHTAVFGLTQKNIGFSSALHSYSDLRISSTYLDLLLNGNDEMDYHFTKKDNQVGGIIYQDFTIGAGNLNLFELIGKDNLPPVKIGIAASVLAGWGLAETITYRGLIHNGIDGLSYNQDLRLQTGVGGIGAKFLIGLKSEPVKNMGVGLAIDNIFSGIHWFGNTKIRHYSVHADSVFAVNLSEDVFVQGDSSYSVSSFTTPFPLRFRLGAIYRFPQASFSADWLISKHNSLITQSIGRLSLGAELLPTPNLPFTTGITIGNDNFPWRISYGLGFRSRFLEFGLGLQSFKAIIPSYHSKGFSLSTYLDIKY